MAVIDELLVGLGFTYDPDDLNEFKDDISKTTGVIKKLAAAAIAGAAAIVGLTQASTAASDEQGKFADEIGDTVENIDALQFALERSGGSAQGMTQSLRRLAVRASEAARGSGEAVKIFGLLGISSTDASGNLKTASDLMLEVSGRFQSLGRTKQIELADKLGIKDSIRLLQQGPDAIRDLINEAQDLGVTTAEDAKIAADFQDSMTNLWKVTKQFSRLLSREFAPIIKSVVDTFLDWWKANREIIEQGLPGWIDKAVIALKLLTLATGAWLGMRLATHVSTLIGLFRGLKLSVLSMNIAMAILPILIGSVVTAIALLAEDASVFFEDGDSFIGDMIKKYPEWADEIRIVAAIFGTISELTGMIFDGWSKIIELFKSDITFQDFKDFFKNIPGFAKESVRPASKESIETADRIFGFFEDLIGLSPLEDRPQPFAPPEFNRRASINNTSNKASTRVDNVNININGGADSSENIAKAVSNVFQQTSQDLNSAVDQ